MRKSKKIKMTSPKGIAVYPHLSEPNRRFDSNGVYEVKLKLEGDEATAFVDRLKNILDDHHTTVSKEMKKKVKRADLPVTEVVDDEGHETGEVEVKFKLKAQFDYEGKTVTQRPVLLDAKKNPITDVHVGSGSTLRIGCEVFPYYTATVGAGLSLRCKVVQVIDLVEYGGGTAGYDFDDEDGFEAVATAMTDEDTGDGVEDLL